MRFLPFIVSILFSFFSTVIMSYISMATVIGPWIDTTLVLMGMLIFSLFRTWYSDAYIKRSLGLSAAAGSIGGILATGVGFSFPTLFFIDNPLFCRLLGNPLLWAGIISSTAFAAGSLGLMTAHLFEYALIVKEELSFPIGELVYKMIHAADSMKKAFMLGVGFVGTFFFLAVRHVTSLLQGPLILMYKRSWGLIALPQLSVQPELLPMFWAIGFVTGHVIAVPLLLGVLAKFLCIEPLYKLYLLGSKSLSSWGAGKALEGVVIHSSLSLHDFVIAFCSGMVLYGALMSFFDVPRLLSTAYRALSLKQESLFSLFRFGRQGSFPWLLVGSVVGMNVAILSYFAFSLTAQCYLILGTLLCTYQMLFIAGKIGLAPLGRFATFVLVPGMFLFGYTPLQIALVSMYVEVAGGVACDALFGRKMAHLAHIDRSTIERYQWLGLGISSLCIGFVIWLFINHFGIGNEAGALSVAKAASRALLVNVKSFDIATLLLGMLFGYILTYFRVNAVLLLGGILMSPDLSLMLILGGLSTYLAAEKEHYYPLWSGVFAANSLWMLMKAFLR